MHGSYNAPVVREGQQLASKEPVETDAILTSLKVTAGYAENISKQLDEFTVKINSKNGILGRLIADSSIVQNIDQTVMNLRNSSKTLDENMNAISKNLLTSLQVTAGNAEDASRQIVELFSKINSNNGTLGRLIQDSALIFNLDQTVVNLKNASQGLQENMKAARENFLFRGYFKKRGKEAEKARIDSIKAESDEQKVNLKKNQ
jgi:phospholipid/cholesterol/gamma-HCH transport system substrate-binding protein